jgi:hypothetical protein
MSNKVEEYNVVIIIHNIKDGSNVYWLQINYGVDVDDENN